MSEEYEYMEVYYRGKKENVDMWTMITEEGEKSLKLPCGSQSSNLEFLNTIGKDGWHFALTVGSYDYFQRKKQVKS